MSKKTAEQTMQTKPGAKPPMQKAAPGTTKRIFWSARPPKPDPHCSCSR